jgi:hypothetical protein
MGSAFLAYMEHTVKTCMRTLSIAYAQLLIAQHNKLKMLTLTQLVAEQLVTNCKRTLSLQ